MSFKVRMSFYKSGTEVAYVVFDAHGANKTTWFDCTRMLYTSYTDLNRLTSVVFCSIDGYVGYILPSKSRNRSVHRIK